MGSNTTKCPACEGQGRYADEVCPQCLGEGDLADTVVLLKNQWHKAESKLEEVLKALCEVKAMAPSA